MADKKDLIFNELLTKKIGERYLIIKILDFFQSKKVEILQKFVEIKIE